MSVPRCCLTAGLVTADGFWAIGVRSGDFFDDARARGEVLLQLIAFPALGVEQVIEIDANQAVHGLCEFVNHPGAFTVRFQQAELLHDSELLGHLNLSDVENLL